MWDGVQQRAGAREVDAWEWECGMEGSRGLGRGKRMRESGCVGWSVGWSAGEIWGVGSECVGVDCGVDCSRGLWRGNCEVDDVEWWTVQLKAGAWEVDA